MAKLNINDLTKEQITRAMNCETPEELMELAKSSGIEITLDEAKAYLEELQDCELDENTLQSVAGGGTMYCEDKAGTCHLHKKLEEL